MVKKSLRNTVLKMLKKIHVPTGLPITLSKVV